MRLFSKKNSQSYEYGVSALSHYMHSNDQDCLSIKLVKEVEESLGFHPGNNPEQIRDHIDNLIHPFQINHSGVFNFSFIDLFAGIGGFRLALQELGGRCVFSSEIDNKAKLTYFTNFGEVPYGDITNEKTKSFIPKEFDVLCAGFPCQAFSIAGKRAGFDDTRGTLFFDVAEIIKRHKPKAIILENVKGLIYHDKRNTLAVILNVLRNDLGYHVPDPQTLNAKHFGIPQQRERIYIVGFRSDIARNTFSYPLPTNTPVSFSMVKEESVVSTKYYVSTVHLESLRKHKLRHAIKKKEFGFGYHIVLDDATASTLLCGGMGIHRNLVYDHRITDFIPQTKIHGEVNKEGIRKMTPREWARLQGFPDKYIIPVADTRAYKQFGNSVTMPVIKLIVKEMLKCINIQVN